MKLLPLFLFLINLFSITPPAAAQQDNGSYGNIYLYYPLEKSANLYTVYLNKKNIGKIINGGRMECKILLDGPVAITLIEGAAYREPLTQSKNTRTMTISKGKSYYFRVTGGGSLEYILSPEKGQTRFMDSKDFIAQPVSFFETPGSPIPSLQSTNN